MPDLCKERTTFCPQKRYRPIALQTSLTTLSVGNTKLQTKGQHRSAASPVLGRRCNTSLSEGSNAPVEELKNPAMSGPPASRHRAAAAETVSRTELARRFVESLVDGTAMDDRPTFDHTALQGLRVVEVADGRIVCEMPVSERVQNRYGTLHGGATATLVDTITTAALLTASPHSGVSVHLAVTYLSPMPGGPPPGRVHAQEHAHQAAGRAAAGQQEDGEVVVVDARVTRVGRQLASLSAELRRKATGQLVATGTHTKFLQVSDPAMAKMREAVAAAGPEQRQQLPPLGHKSGEGGATGQLSGSGTASAQVAAPPPPLRRGGSLQLRSML